MSPVGDLVITEREVIQYLCFLKHSMIEEETVRSVVLVSRLSQKNCARFVPTRPARPCSPKERRGLHGGQQTSPVRPGPDRPWSDLPRVRGFDSAAACFPRAVFTHTFA